MAGIWSVTPSAEITDVGGGKVKITFPANPNNTSRDFHVYYKENGHCGQMTVTQKPGSGGGGGGGGTGDGTCKIRIVNNTSTSLSLSCHECTSNPTYDAKIFVGESGYYSARIDLPHSNTNIGANGRFPADGLYSTSFNNDGDSSMSFFNDRTRHNNLYENGTNITDLYRVYVFINGINGTPNRLVDGGEYEITIEN